jgi:hypothetical protein
MTQFQSAERLLIQLRGEGTLMTERIETGSAAVLSDSGLVIIEG